MIDHIGISVSQFEASRDFYKRALAPLGYELIMEIKGAAGFGRKGKPDFWIQQGEKVTQPVHVAIRCDNRELVDSFYKAAMEAGGKDNGAPGLREQYHPNYYGAFVLDPDGHNIEAVCHQ